MAMFEDWQKYVVTQKHPNSGCIPTGYEFLIKAAGVTGVNFDTFQEEFDLDKDRKEGEPFRNNFYSVKELITQKYPYIQIAIKPFPMGEGAAKLIALEGILSQERSVLVSLFLLPIYNINGYHIMPVVGTTDSSLILLDYTSPNGELRLMELGKRKLVEIHDNFPGGDEIAYLNE
jgi:hypothetical protein